MNVHIANNSSKTVKKIKVSVRQFADICLFSTAQYKCTVAEIESEWVELVFLLPFPCSHHYRRFLFIIHKVSLFLHSRHTLKMGEIHHKICTWKKLLKVIVRVKYRFEEEKKKAKFVALSDEDFFIVLLKCFTPLCKCSKIKMYENERMQNVFGH